MNAWEKLPQIKVHEYGVAIPYEHLEEGIADCLFGDGDYDAMYDARYPDATAEMLVPTFETLRDCEDWVKSMVDALPAGVQAMIYKQLYAQGMRISDCADAVSKYAKSLKP